MSYFVHSDRPQSLQQMEPILETLNDGVVIADDSDQILFVNTVFEEMTGFPRSQIIGRDARQLYHRAEELDFARALNQRRCVARWPAGGRPVTRARRSALNKQDSQLGGQLCRGRLLLAAS
jgi:PAS domain S-box-containing protein